MSSKFVRTSETAYFHFDTPEAKGTVTVTRGAYGVEIMVNDVCMAVVDLCPCVDGGPPQLILDGDWDDQPLAKYGVGPLGRTIVVNKEAEYSQISTPFDIHFDDAYGGGDGRYILPEPTE